ncbi:DNA polymerase III subunits gamma and tau [Vibrio variabilis]|uniref:DNA polymerase III subunits gamma and tau n=1 Tax=Vibrio variabilis TaxID=990271 RepID=A0ABQ0J754_9VIBR|nr:DNA polymerase III subunits gamma and tau [Vibrio variabilis]
MSYLALARKWRPKKFSEVVGQAHVLTALENALDQTDCTMRTYLAVLEVWAKRQ